jgi:hypothetical protein
MAEEKCMKTMRWGFALLALSSASVLVAGNYGEPVPLGRPLPLAAALEAPPEGNILFSGRVVEVCQKKGCWAMLEDDGRAVRLMMHDHAFFLPKDYRGPAVVWGVMEEIEMSESMAQHLAEDAGQSEPVERREFRIDTLGIRLVGEEG